jgi:peroxiredoxin
MEQSLSNRLTMIVLPDADGREIRLGSLWESRPVVLVFLRHYGCIFCREHVAQLREHEEAFSARGASLAAIGLGDRHYARAFREQTGIEFRLLIDEKREAYQKVELRSANLLHLLKSDYAKNWKRAQAAGHHQHKLLGRNPFQLGGSFVFGPGDIDRFAHYSETFGDNASPESMLAALP